MRRKITLFVLASTFFVSLYAQQPPSVKQFLQLPSMQGATFSLLVKEVNGGKVLYSYDADRQVTPASVLKTVTTATALEILGEDYRFTTTLEYDGELKDGILQGNLYIKGGGDPTLGSSHFATDKNNYTPAQNTFIPEWVAALKKKGIQKITGSIISDESIFDTEGISPKGTNDDIGNYYAAGCYGLSVFDNQYKLFLKTGSAGSHPVLRGCDPQMPSISFHNYLTTTMISTDSAFISGMPFSSERYLYGAVPANKEWFSLKGDIPDPALFLADYLTVQLKSNGIIVEGKPSCYRIESEGGQWKPGKRTPIITTYSPPLKEITAIINGVSHNLYADALLKTMGLQYQPVKGEVISSFGRGIKVVQKHWESKKIKTSALWMYDGCGLGATNKVSATFIADMLTYMAARSTVSKAYFQSLPQVGVDGTVRNFMKGSSLQGKARLKSGGMSRVRCYAGYVTKDGKQYAVTVFTNNYSCSMSEITKELEKLLLSLF